MPSVIRFNPQAELFSELRDAHPKAAAKVNSSEFIQEISKCVSQTEENISTLKEKRIFLLDEVPLFVGKCLLALALLAGGIAMMVFTPVAIPLVLSLWAIPLLLASGMVTLFSGARAFSSVINNLKENSKSLVHLESELICLKKNQEFFAPKHPIFEEVMAQNWTLEDQSFEPTQEIKLLQEAANADKEEEKEEIFQELFHGYAFRAFLLPPEIVEHINQFSKENQ